LNIVDSTAVPESMGVNNVKIGPEGTATIEGQPLPGYDQSNSSPAKGEGPSASMNDSVKEGSHDQQTQLHQSAT